MKRFLALMLAILSVFLLAACGQTAEKKPAEEGKAPETSGTADVAVFYYNFADPYISTVRANMDDLLKAKGISFQNYDGNTVQATQTDQINTAITNGAKLLIVNIVDSASDAAKKATEAAEAAGIPVIFFNREVTDDVINGYDKSVFVGTDPAEAGHMQGKMIGQFVDENFDKIDLNGDGVITYVMFKGQEGNPEAEFRTQYGVEDADAYLKEKGRDALKFYDETQKSGYLVDPDGAWSAKAATDHMNNILAEYTMDNKNMVELVIANNDAMAEGAIAALQQQGFNNGGDTITIPVFGVDAMDSAKQKIQEGVMTGTIMQDAKGMAEAIMLIAENALAGNELLAGTDTLIVDAKCAKVRIPYQFYTGK